MSLHAFAIAAGYLGAALGVAMVVPQIARTLRDRAVPGVSALSWGLTALACTAWLLYGIRTGEMPQIPGNVLLVSGAVVIVLMVPSAVSMPRRAGYLAVPAMAFGALATVAPAAVTGVVAVGVALVSTVPQTVTSLRRRGESASAVSLAAWLLRVASQGSWLFYGVVIADLTVAVCAVFLLSNAVLVVVVEAARRPAPARAVALA